MKEKRKSAAGSKQKKIRYQNDLEKEVKILEEKKASMSSKLSNLEEEIEVLMDNNKELKNQVDVTKYLKAELQRLKEKSALNEQTTLEIQQQKVATSEQIQNLDIQSMDPNIFHKPKND